MHKSIMAKRWDNPRLAKQAVAKKSFSTFNKQLNLQMNELDKRLCRQHCFILQHFFIALPVNPQGRPRGNLFPRANMRPIKTVHCSQWEERTAGQLR